MNYQVHETAIIDKGAHIGANTKVWHRVHITSGAIIGSDVVLGQNVFVGNKAVIGHKCRIQNNVSIYDNVLLEECVFCGPNVVFTNILNPRALIDRKNQYKDTIIKRGASLGANSTILCGVVIGEFAFIGAGAVVSKNVPAYALMVGVPAKQVGWVGEYGNKLSLPPSGNSETTCSHTGQKYKLFNSKLSRVL